nr:NAD(P)/FAD-dependent oxidoreductase [Bacillus piscicola]
MGAGLSGLACAITLEKNGITPAIFESRGQAGDRFVNGEVLLSIFTHPISDCIASLAEDYGIYLQPTAPIQRMRLFSENEQATIEGRFGFSNVRGREEHAFEAQLERQTKTDIHYHSKYSLDQLQREYTHVVVATGDGDDAKEMRNFHTDFTVSLKGATVTGEFDRYTVMAWLDHTLAPYGYCFLIPFSEKEANITIAIPDLPVNKNIQMDELWERFHPRVQAHLNQELPITDQFDITRYPIGICESPRIGNTFFVGNCFGTMMPFLGFGQHPAMLSGIYAAYDLCGFGKYEELTKPLRKKYENSLVLRQSIEQLSNKGFDRMIKALHGPWGGKLFQPRKLDPLRTASYLLRPYVKLKGARP